MCDSGGVDLRIWITTDLTALRDRFHHGIAAHVPPERWTARIAPVGSDPDRPGRPSSSIAWLLFHLSYHQDLAINAAVRRFWMKNTLLPLSIAFADPSGVVVGTADMDPCTADPCPNYGPDAPSTLAVEVPQGALDELGLVEGSTVEVIGDCPVGSG